MTHELEHLALRIMIGARNESGCHPTSRSYLQRVLPHFTKEEATSFIASNLMQFDRDYNSMLLLCAPELWVDFEVSDWAKLIEVATPRPRRGQCYNTGMFSDVSFLLRWIRIDALKLISITNAGSTDDKLAIAEYCWRFAPFALSSSESPMLGWDDDATCLEFLAKAKAGLTSRCPSLDECPSNSDELRTAAHKQYVVWSGLEGTL